jgi:hypothetical protein
MMKVGIVAVSPDEALFTAMKAAQFLGIDVTEFVNWQSLGLGPRREPAPKHGGVVYSRRALEQFVAQGGIERAHVVRHM